MTGGRVYIHKTLNLAGKCKRTRSHTHLFDSSWITTCAMTLYVFLIIIFGKFIIVKHFRVNFPRLYHWTKIPLHVQLPAAWSQLPLYYPFHWSPRAKSLPLSTINCQLSDKASAILTPEVNSRP